MRNRLSPLTVSKLNAIKTNGQAFHEYQKIDLSDVDIEDEDSDSVVDLSDAE